MPRANAPALPPAIAQAVKNQRLELIGHTYGWTLRCTVVACSRAWIVRHADAHKAGEFEALLNDLEAHRFSIEGE